MKALIFLFWLAPLPAVAAVDYLYALRCPGDAALKLSNRRDWEKAGFTVPSSGSPDLEKEKEFQGKRLANLSHAYAEKMLEPRPATTNWQKGIRFQPDGFGLPPAIDGCEVVPFVMLNQDIQYGPLPFVGSLDDFRSLSPLDQWLAELLLSGNDPALLRAFFSNEAERLPLRNREGLLYQLNWSRVSYLDFEVSICTDWSTASTPTWCDGVYLMGADSASEGTFWGNGYPRSFFVGSGGDVRLSYDKKSPNYSKFQHCSGTITYAENGAFVRCK